MYMCYGNNSLENFFVKVGNTAKLDLISVGAKRYKYGWGLRRYSVGIACQGDTRQNDFGIVLNWMESFTASPTAVASTPVQVA